MGRSTRPPSCCSERPAAPISVRPFASYLKAKLSDVYGMDLSGVADDAAGLNMKTNGK